MAGNIHVITGPMRSRKTLDIILMAKEAVISGYKFMAFHPAIGSRWSDTEIVSRMEGNVAGEEYKLSIPSTPLTSDMPNFLESLPDDVDIVIFDDAQFFSNKIISVCNSLRRKGVDVYINGLDMDSFLQPFGPMPYLMAIADDVKKLTAVCVDCQARAQVSYRLSNDKQQQLVGDKEYIPLCYSCYHDRRAEEDLNFIIEEDNSNE